MVEHHHETPREAVSLRRKFFAPQTLISFLLLGALLAFITTRFDIAWGDTWDSVRTIDPVLYGLAILVHYMTFLFRGARWRVLLMNAAKDDESPPKPPSVISAACLILMSWFANAVTWFRMGDAYRAYVYSTDAKASFPRTAGTVVADRLVDMAVVSLLLVVGVAVLLIGGQIRPPLIILYLALGVLVLIPGGLCAMKLTRNWLGVRLPRRISEFYGHFHDGTVGSFGRVRLVFALGLLAWSCEIGRLFFVILALGTPIGLGLIIFVPMANGVLSAIPITPGGIGIVETGVSGALQLELSVEVAIAVALVDRSISYVSIIVTGGAAFFVRQFRSPNRTAAPSKSD